MVLERELTKQEFYTLLESAPEEESDTLINYTRQINKRPWDFFQEFGLTFYGILIDNVPIYFGCLYDEGDDIYKLWTLRKTEIKEQFTLFKLCKRKITQTARKYNPIYAVNRVENKLITKWNMRLGFLPYKIENDLVYYKMDNYKEA
jgi:hypothetical protein